MRLKGLLAPLSETNEFNEFINCYNKSIFPLGIYGLSDSGKSYFIYNLFNNQNKSMMIVADSDIEAKKIYEDLSFYTTEVYYLPSKEVVFYNVYAISGDLRWERLKVINQILNRKKKIVVTSIESLVGNYTPLKMYKKFNFKFKVGDTIDINNLKDMLISSGYQKVDLVEGKGEFSVRGGIVDIYCPINSEPYRLEFFGDEIDSIRSFNQDSQRSIDKLESINISPAKEIILKEENIKIGIDNILKDLNKFLNSNESNEIKQKVENTVKRNIENLKESGTFETIDSFIPYFYDECDTLFDYVNNYSILIDNVKRSLGKLDSVYSEFHDNFKSLFQNGDVLSNQINLLISKQETLDKLEEKATVIVEGIQKTNEYLVPKKTWTFNQKTIFGYKGKIELLLDDIKEKKQLGYKTLILSGTRTRGERLVKTLKELEIESVYKDTLTEFNSGDIIVTFGNQTTGFDYEDLNLCVISDKDIFGKFTKRVRKNKRSEKGTAKIKSFMELKPGDYVVHANHGIGVFKGINQLDLQGHKKDYLEVIYDSDDKLYVPVEQLDMVQRYIGSEGKKPKVNKLGSSEWNKTKKKVKKSIQEIAEDLVKLYAIRSTLKGHKYCKDTVWQKQFEDEFPYEETPDQITAIDDIKKDMESEKAMDRLLCGDVGYGKTEVAIRAAFKAIMDGKQVAFLVPTTILAQQHYNNLKNRFSDFPITVDVISRFRSISEQKSTIKSLKEGNIDILIGTHRILQKDIKFKELGLLIIDEEQRFGVTHKEKIKGLKKNIDVLTLSATPIPRTLHMSLVGVRDISVIETPPEERYPVQTYVTEYNEQLIRDAILRELSRGGQIYFVYNRVENIHEMASNISKLIPEAKISVAHGQMKERELENVVMEFTEHKSDILVATTIIETGMDIQNVNTMIIYDADKMGLSQLYQLRGRVGRTNRMAYCYLTYTKDKLLTEVAEKRLKAIKDFTQLGSGFKIALKDLEIRGAGNMMGSSQHGHMSSIGYDLYCRMLEDTIKLIKGEIDKEPIETSVELKVDAYIPNSYIKNETQKIQVYKKIASIESKEEVVDIKDELIDRFSDIPESVNNLIDIAYIKCLAKKLDIEEIKETKQEVIFNFDERKKFSQDFMKQLIDKYSKDVVFKISKNPSLGLKIKNSNKDLLLREIKQFVECFVKNNE